MLVRGRGFCVNYVTRGIIFARIFFPLFFCAKLTISFGRKKEEGVCVSKIEEFEGEFQRKRDEIITRDVIRNHEIIYPVFSNISVLEQCSTAKSL